MKQLKQIKLNKIIELILVVFFIIQPIFDLKIFYGSSICIFTRVIVIFILFSYYFITSSNKKKYLLFLYPIIIGIYFILHHLNALNFVSLVPGNFNYSLRSEFLYFVQMGIPFLLIYALFKSELSNEYYFKIIRCIVLLIGLIIIISNILGLSYGAYSDTRIAANFFGWFNPDYDYLDLASKGFFEYANQIGAILIMYLPYSIISTTLSKNKKQEFINIFTLIVNVFALILLCTRVSVLGLFIVFLYTICSCIFISALKNFKLNIKKYIPMATVFTICILVLPINPIFSRLEERVAIQSASEAVENIDNNEINTCTTIPEDKSNTEQQITYIENIYPYKQLHEQFLFETYPYKYDPEFWYNFLQNDNSLTTNYRYVELSIIKRVVEINNNPMDKFLGITNIRLQNIFNIERDFIVQYYAFGIVGLFLFFLPYFTLLISFIYKSIKLKFNNLTILNLLSFITILLLFAISYFSGNLLNSLSFTIHFAILFVLLSKNKGD